MNKLKMLWNLMKGSRLLYTGAVISIGLATLVTLLNPLVIRITIDSIIGGKPMEAPPYIIRIIEAAGGRSYLLRNLWLCGAVLVILTILNGLFMFLRGKWSAEAAEDIARNIRNKVYDHLQYLHYDYHVKAKTGDLIQRCTSDVDTIRTFLSVHFVEVGRAVFMMVFTSIVMFSLDTRLALVSMTVIPIIFTAAVIFFSKVQKAFQLSDEAEGRLSTVLQENLTGMRVVRAFGRQSFEIEKYDVKNTEYRDLTYRLIRLLAWYWSGSDLLCLLQIAAIVVIGAYWAASGTLTLGTLVVFTTYEGMLLWPVRQMGRILTDMGKTFVSASRIKEILDEQAELMEETGDKPEIRGEVEFDRVSFSYRDDMEVLEDISFRIKPGQTISLMGPTGSGKTTLVNLLLRLYDYSGGSIKIDGHELRNIDKKWLRQNIGIVSQEPFLFSKTLSQNIGITKVNVQEEEVFEAARIAHVHNVIQDFEKGYETMVGERGVTLSGGQKQRVAIARTIINRYPVLIFDDSLSAVDTETDASIRRALKDRKKGITTFIISHRVTTLAEADLILVLDKGRLVQSGTHEELLAVDGLYKKVWSIQNELEEDLEQDLHSPAS